MVINEVVKAIYELKRSLDRIHEILKTHDQRSKESSDREIIERFITSQLVFCDGAILSAQKIYQRFATWWVENKSGGLPPSQKRLGKALWEANFRKIKRGGTIRYLDAVFRESWPGL